MLHGESNKGLALFGVVLSSMNASVSKRKIKMVCMPPLASVASSHPHNMMVLKRLSKFWGCGNLFSAAANTINCLWLHKLCMPSRMFTWVNPNMHVPVHPDEA